MPMVRFCNVIIDTEFTKYSITMRNITPWPTMQAKGLLLLNSRNWHKLLQGIISTMQKNSTRRSVISIVRAAPGLKFYPPVQFGCRRHQFAEIGAYIYQ